MHVNDNILLFFKTICTAANAVTAATYVFYVTQAITVCLITKEEDKEQNLCQTQEQTYFRTTTTT